MPELDPGGAPVEAGGVVLRTPGVTGRAEAVRPGAGGTRSGRHVSERVAAALAGTDVREQVDVELDGVTAAPARPGGGRGGAGRPEIVADVPAPAEGQGQVVLLVGPGGLLTWHAPEPVAAGPGNGTRGAGAVVRYRLPVPEPVGGAGRGPLGAVGKLVVKVLAFALHDALGRLGERLVARWEREHRWYALRHATGAGLAGEDVSWPRLREPALLLVHGTFSRCDSGFAGLAGSLPGLAAGYPGGVLLFDHPSVSVDPVANAQWLADAFAAGTADRPDARLVVDVVCHSRGGLVARALAEQQDRLDLHGRSIEVRSVAFVGAPNAGTALADPAHLGTFLDTWTNLLDLVPDVGAVDALQLVIEVVKQLATGVAEGLDGLMAMNPAGPYLQALNESAQERDAYAAVAAEFEPAAGGTLRQRALDGLVDAVFGQANDLVVPRDGVWQLGSGSLVPPARRLAIQASRGISHCDYFGQPDVREALAGWLAPA